MHTPEDHSDEPEIDRPEGTSDGHGLASIDRSADDPQTRPAVDPEVGLAERRIPEDT
jgi:hypothetical protein